MDDRSFLSRRELANGRLLCSALTHHYAYTDHHYRFESRLFTYQSHVYMFNLIHFKVDKQTNSGLPWYRRVLLYHFSLYLMVVATVYSSLHLFILIL